MNDTPRRLNKIDYLRETPVFCNRVTVRELSPPDCAPSLLHFHEFVEISMVIAGRGIHRTLNEASECGVGDVYVINAGVPHGYFALHDGEEPVVCNILFDPADLFDGEFSVPGGSRYCLGVFSKNTLAAHFVLRQHMLEELGGVIQKIERELTAKEDEWQPAVKAYLVILLTELGRCAAPDNLSDRTSGSKDRRLVLSVLQAVMDRLGDREMTLENIADSLYISKSHLSRIFRRVMGEPFSDYVRRIRLEQACRLLRETDLTNEQIVFRCGLRDVPSFYRMFKSYTAVTPHQYRKGISRSDKKESNVKFDKNRSKGVKTMSEAILNEISENLQRGKAKMVKELVQQAVDAGIAPDVILNEGLLSGMNIVGEKFKNNEVYVPEVLVAARAMNMGTQTLKPLLAAAGVKATGKVCIGTVQGDLHDIGKNLVKMMLEGKGLEVVDLGTDVAPETFVQTAIDENCQIICCSALLTTTMGVMEDVVKKAEEAGIRGKVKIMIGGAPVNEEFFAKIGADTYTPDAASAADAAVAFCRGEA